MSTHGSREKTFFHLSFKIHDSFEDDSFGFNDRREYCFTIDDFQVSMSFFKRRRFSLNKDSFKVFKGYNKSLSIYHPFGYANIAKAGYIRRWFDDGDASDYTPWTHRPKNDRK